MHSEIDRPKPALRLTLECCDSSTRQLLESNEEFHALNEELLSASDEPRGRQARLQSANEKLGRLNRSYLNKIGEVCRANSDLHSLMAATGIGTLFLNRDLRIQSFTAPVRDIFSIGTEDIDCTVDRLAVRLDYPSLPAHCETVLRTRQASEFELSRPDGRCFLARLLPYRSMDDTIDGMVITFIDISERCRAEAARFDDKERAQMTLASIGEGVIITDPSGRIESINPRAEILTGSASAESRGLPWLQVVRIRREDNGEPAADVVKQCLREQQIIDPGDAAILMRGDGAEIPVELSVAPILDRAGRNLGAVIVLRDISEHRRLVRQISHQATHDSLTGLINRPEFERRLQLMLQHARDLHRQHALCYLDLDQFKLVNDTFGHVAGDALLRQLSGFLQVRVRRARDTFARLGGDEFGLLLGECGLDHATRVAEQLRDAVQDFCFIWENRPFRIGVSIGVTAINARTPDVSSVLSNADAACFIAKERGRNCVQVYRPEADEIVRRRSDMQWIYRLQEAMSEDRFRLHYQPIVAIGPEPDTGAHGELLLRMLDADGQVLLPGAFIPAAERYHQMLTVDRWVIGAAFSMLSGLKCDSPPQSYSINLSAQSLSNAEFLRFAVGELENSGVAPARVCFEITETAAIANLPAALEFIKTLKAKGCRFALDDFGSGLSSFAYLKNLPVDYLKIDGCFVRQMAHDPVDCAMVETINRVGHLMGLKTIAESVDSDAALEKLKALGVDYVQGFGIAGVIPLENHSRG